MLKNISIKQKLVLMIMITSVVALVLASFAVVVFDTKTFKSAMINELTRSAKIIGNNSSAAIVFNDKDSAGEILSGLKADEHIVLAALLVNGTPLAFYTRDRVQYSPSDLQNDGYHFSSKHLALFQSIYFKGKKIGAVYIEHDLAEIRSRVEQYCGAMFVIILLVSVVTFLLASRFQQVISLPVLQLVDTTKHVSQTNNYSVHVEKYSNDEIGQLFDGFNRMMQQIQSRDVQLIDAQNKLEHRVQERTNSLRLTNLELAASEKELRKTLVEMEAAHKELEHTQNQLLQSEKLASIGQLAAGVAHEINNPVGFISNNVEVLGQYVADYARILDVTGRLRKSIEAGRIDEAKAISAEMVRLEEEINLPYVVEDTGKLLHFTQKGIERIQKIVKDLRTFAREDTDEMEMVKIEEVIDSILSIVHNELKYKAELKKEYGETPLFKCSPQRLGQVFINLFVNAAQAIPEKGVIGIKTYQQGNYVCVEVSDTGQGIPPENLNKIFDPFFTTKPIGQGTGLGLSVSYEIIKKHAGDIKVRSEVGKGTTFTVMLPVSGSPS